MCVTGKMIHPKKGRKNGVKRTEWNKAGESLQTGGGRLNGALYLRYSMIKGGVTDVSERNIGSMGRVHREEKGNGD